MKIIGQESFEGSIRPERMIEFAQLRSQVLSSKGTVEPNSAFRQLYFFERNASVHYRELLTYINRRGAEKDWIHEIERLDLLTANAPPDRPWTKVILKNSINAETLDISRISLDLDMFGSIVRHDDELHRILQSYYQSIVEIPEFTDAGHGYHFVDGQGKEVYSELFYIEDDQGGYEFDWDQCDIAEQTVQQAITLIINKTRAFSKLGNESAWSWSLVELLCDLEGKANNDYRLPQFWTLLFEALLHDKELFPLSLRARWLICNNAALTGIVEEHEASALFTKRFSQLRDILDECLIALHKWVDPIIHNDHTDEAIERISLMMLDELRIAIQYSPMWKNAMLGLMDSVLKADRDSMIAILASLFEATKKIYASECMAGLSLESRMSSKLQPWAENEDSHDQFEKLRKSLMNIESAKDFVSVLRGAVHINESHSRRNVITAHKSKDWGLPEGADLLHWHFLQKEEIELKAEEIAELKAALLSNRERSQTGGTDIRSMIRAGESKKLEFKSSLRINTKSGDKDTKIEHAVLKTIAAFLNTDGGTLLIGVADDGTALGVSVDKFDSEDKMKQHLDNLIKGRFVPNCVEVDAHFEEYEGVRICVVRCHPSQCAIYLKNEGSEEFYRRCIASSQLVATSLIEVYIRQHWGEGSSES